MSIIILSVKVNFVVVTMSHHIFLLYEGEQYWTLDREGQFVFWKLFAIAIDTVTVTDKVIIYVHK